MSKVLVDLGQAYVSDFVSDPQETANRKKYPVQLVWNFRLGCPTLTYQPPKEEMWGKYWYKSGTNISMQNALKEVVADTLKHIKSFEKGDIWLDIASNDGTLLKHVPSLFYKVGIDPIEDKYTEECRQHANAVIQDYFNEESWAQVPYWEETKKAKVVTSIAMFYDLEDPHQFARDVYNAMDTNGIWVMQLSYTPLMIEQLAFDNILGEHYAYHYLNSLKNILSAEGFVILDTELNDVNGGSIRVYAIKKDADKTKFGTQPLRDVWGFRTESLLEYEGAFYGEDVWKDFEARMNLLRMKVTDFIRKANQEGKSVWGYGASTKGNTLLQYFELDGEMIEAIAERNPDKYGLYTIGSNIPIKSEEEMRLAQPDYVLVMPWHFISEFVQRESEYLKNGGAFIVPCPKFEIIRYEGNDR